MKINRYILAILLTLSLCINFAAFRPKHSQVLAIDPNDYPSIWRDQAKDSMTDSWDNLNKECTSYVSWKVFETYHYSTRDWGAAYQWVFQAYAHGIVVDNTPAIHAVLVDPSFHPGHVMWIEKLNTDNTVHVSEYNGDGTGHYSERDIDVSGMQIIHF